MIRSSIRFVLAALSIAVLAGSVGAALTGRIVDQSGTPLSNAVVKLQSANLADTTAADGQFSFTVSGVLMPAASPLKQAITCANGVISFTISSEAEPVTIRLFDVSGRQVAPSFTQELSPGEYSFDALSLIQGAALGRIFIARVSLDDKMYSYKISFQAGERRRLMGNGRTGDLRASGLAKREAGIDMLQISRSGYVTTTISLSSYDANLGDIALTAQQYVLSIVCNPVGGGTITAPASSPVNASYGAQTIITASPNTGYSFVNWTVTSGTASIADVNSASTTVTLTSGNATVQANFALSTGQLTVVAGTGGTITAPASSPVTVPYGVATAITATPSACYSFTGWTVPTGVTIDNASSPSAHVTLNSGNATVTANFAYITYQLTVNAGTGGTVSPSGASTVTCGVATAITATPSTGYSFTGWTVPVGVTIDNASSASAHVTLNSGNATVTANFSINCYPVTVQNATISPNKSCYDYGTTITITANTPPSCYSFSGWSGSATGTSNPLSITVNGPITIAANYVPVSSVNLKVDWDSAAPPPNGEGISEIASGNLACGGTVTIHTALTYTTAPLPPNYTSKTCLFSHWQVVSGNVVISMPLLPVTTVTPTSNAEVSAVYTCQ